LKFVRSDNQINGKAFKYNNVSKLKKLSSKKSLSAALSNKLVDFTAADFKLNSNKQRRSNKATLLNMHQHQEHCYQAWRSGAA